MYKLYWNKDTAAVAPEMVLEEAGLAYEKVVIDAFGGETWQADYLAINPAGYIPALIREDGSILYESAAISLYICDRHGLSELLPPLEDPDRGGFSTAGSSTRPARSRTPTNATTTHPVFRPTRRTRRGSRPIPMFVDIDPLRRSDLSAG